MSRHRRTRLRAIALAAIVCSSLNSVLVPSAATAALEREKIDKLQLIQLLKAGRYEELNRKLGSVQSRYEAAEIDDGSVNTAFGAFAHADPALERNLDDWVDLHPKVFVPYLARAVYFTHIGQIYRGEHAARNTDRQQVVMMRKHFARATTDLRSALSFNTHLPTAYSKLILVQAMSGQTSRALETFRIAEAELPHGSLHILMLAHFSGRSWTGVKFSRKAFMETVSVSQRPDDRYDVLDGYEHFAEAKQLRIRRRFDRAARMYDLAIAVNKMNSSYYFGRAKNNWFRKRYESALKDLAQASTLQHQNPYIYEMMALIYSRQKKYHLALDYIGQAIALDPYNPGYLVGLAQIHRDAKQFFKARDDLEKAQVYGGNDPVVQAARARFFAEVDRDLPKARDTWRRTVELAPYYGEYLRSYWLALIAVHDCGSVEAAIRYLRICLRERTCNQRQIMHTSSLVNGTVRESQCPYERHHVAHRFRPFLTNKDLQRLETSKEFAPYPRQKPFVGRSAARRMTLEGLKLGMTEKEVRHIFPDLKIERSFVRDTKIQFMAIAKLKSLDGRRDMSVMFSHFGTVETIYSIGDAVIVAKPSEINRKVDTLRRALKKPYGKSDKEMTNPINGKYLIEFRQTNDKQETVASLMIEHQPPRILRKKGDTVVYGVKIQQALVDKELVARSRKTIQRLVSASRKK